MGGPLAAVIVVLAAFWPTGAGAESWTCDPAIELDGRRLTMQVLPPMARPPLRGDGASAREAGCGEGPDRTIAVRPLAGIPPEVAVAAPRGADRLLYVREPAPGGRPWPPR